MNFNAIAVLALLMLTASSLKARQSDTTYFDDNWDPCEKAGSTFYRVTKTIEAGKKYEFTDYNTAGKLERTGAFSSLNPEVKDGVFTWYDDNGEKTQETVYDKGRVISKRSLRTDEGTKPQVVALERQPQYPGGIKKFYEYLANNFIYPKGLKPRPKGVIPVSFVIEKDGSITEVFVVKPLHPLLDAEAIRLVENSEKWIPGMQHGKPVRVMYTVPLNMD